MRTFEFGSTFELVKVAKTAPATCIGKDNSEYKIDFYGGTWEEAIEQAEIGNPELITDIISVIPKADEPPYNNFSRDVTGDFFDVGDFLSGEPECCWSSDTEQKREAVNIIVNIGFPESAPADGIKRRGGAIVGLIDNMQKRGYIVNLSVCILGIDYGKKGQYEPTLIKIHVDTRPVDIASIAYMIANPLFLRRIIFAFFATYRKKDAREIRVCDDTKYLGTKEDERYIYFAAVFLGYSQKYMDDKISEFFGKNKKITTIY